MKYFDYLRAVLVALVVVLAGCNMSSVKMGGGDSPVTGSSGAAGSTGAKNNVVTCSSKRWMASLSSGNMGGQYMQITAMNQQILVQNGLPGNPTPLL